jgi:Zn-dependent protease
MIARYVLRRMLARVLPYLWPIVLVAFILLTEPPAYALFLLAATALHETGHLFAFFACGEPLPRFGGRGFGLLLTPQGGSLFPKHELMICAAGPLFNLAGCLALIPALHAGVASEANFCFFALNLLTALFNLLPLSGFDGGRMLSATLSLTCPPPVARAVCAAVSLGGALFFYFVALFLSFVAGAGIYPFALAAFLVWNEGKRWPALWEDF